MCKHIQTMLKSYQREDHKEEGIYSEILLCIATAWTLLLMFADQLFISDTEQIQPSWAWPLQQTFLS